MLTNCLLLDGYSLYAVKQDDFSDVPLPALLPGAQDVTPKEN